VGGDYLRCHGRALEGSKCGKRCRRKQFQIKGATQSTLRTGGPSTAADVVVVLLVTDDVQLNTTLFMFQGIVVHFLLLLRIHQRFVVPKMLFTPTLKICLFLRRLFARAERGDSRRFPASGEKTHPPRFRRPRRDEDRGHGRGARRRQRRWTRKREQS